MFFNTLFLYCVYHLLYISFAETNINPYDPVCRLEISISSPSCRLRIPRRGKLHKFAKLDGRFARATRPCPCVNNDRVPPRGRKEPTCLRDADGTRKRETRTHGAATRPRDDGSSCLGALSTAGARRAG